jgi:Ca2+-binding RTX toxin-like protein
LPAITWVNRLTATDTFTAAERVVVDQALRYWDSLIADFDNVSTNAPHTFHVTLTGGSTSGLDLGGSRPGTTDNHTANAAGLPSSARIRIDADAGGSPAGWYIDPVPGDNAEFTSLATRFAADGGPAGQDLYTTLLRELAHALGFAVEYTRFAGRVTNDPPPAATRTYTGASGLKATLGPAADGTYLDPTAHPHDLLNANQPSRTRHLPSDLDVRLLADAFGYTVALPSTRQTFLANLNQTTGLLTVHGDPQVIQDTLTLDRQGANLRVQVNSIVATFPASTLTAVTVLAGAGADVVNVDHTPAGIGVTVDGGADNDAIHASPTAGFLDTLAGPLTVHGGPGADALTLHDAINPFGDTYALTATTVGRPLTAPITFGTVESMVLNAGSGSSTFNIQGTAPGTAVTVHAGAGNDTIHVSPLDNFLNHLAGALTVQGGAGTDALHVHDQANPFSDPYTLTATTVARPSAGLLTYATLETLMLRAGSGSSTFHIQGTAAGLDVTVLAGAGNDTFNVGNTANTLDALLGALDVDGQGGTDVLNLLDQGASAARSYTLTSTTVRRTGAATTGHDNVESVVVQAGSGNDTITTSSTSGDALATVNAGAGNDTFVGPSGANTWSLTGGNAGTLNGTVHFTATENLSGGSSADTFVLSVGQGVTGTINGQGGTDVLSYAAFIAAVTVNLATGSAPGAGNVSNVENVTGGAGNDLLRGNGLDNVLVGGGGNDLLLGGAGDDSLDGGSGRDVLIGGVGSDRLEGGQDDDLLIAGSTSYNADDAALLAILAEWARADRTYDERTRNLRSSLNATTVTHDGIPDEVFGQAGLDWFWVDGLDRTDQGAGELIN